MPFDAYWTRYDLFYEFEVEKRTHLPRDGSKVVFEPGEIAWAPGGLKHAFYSFLRTLGYKLTPREERLAASTLHRSEGKYCVVLERIDASTYWTCYLTTFDRVASGAHIGFPSGRYFGLAVGKAPEWPPGFSPLDTSPPWTEHAYVYAAPILRKDLQIPFMNNGTPHARRRFLLNGQLERVRREMVNKVTHFPRVADTLRQAVLTMESELNRGGGLANFDFIDEGYEVMARRREHSHDKKQLPPSRRSLGGRAERFRYIEPTGKPVKHALLANPADTMSIEWPLRYLQADSVACYDYLSYHPPLGYAHLKRIIGQQSKAEQQWEAYVSTGSFQNAQRSTDARTLALNTSLLSRIQPTNRTRNRTSSHTTETKAGSNTLPEKSNITRKHPKRPFQRGRQFHTTARSFTRKLSFIR